ncbi:hypothetical protein HY480_00915 [Candidatus Uhrbacteria bacterium]|nr:hypothetical protein [Candidatus Uhrbacteria bacterium]
MLRFQSHIKEHLMPLPHIPGLTDEGPLTWTQVFAIWRTDEGDDSHWGPHARERGFPNWEAWRMTYATPLRLPERSWSLYRVDDPIVWVPMFRGGPFGSWIRKYYRGAPHPSFTTLARHPDIISHDGVLALRDAFPNETTITGLLHDEGIVIVEGMHRCCAIALAAAQGKPLAITLHLALADARGEMLPPVGQTGTLPA